MDLPDMISKAGDHLEPELLQKTPLRKTVQWFVSKYEEDDRLKQKGVFPDKTNAKSEKYDSKGSEEYYGAIDDESMVEPASKEQMEHPVTDKMTRDTSMGVEYAPAPELILWGDMDLPDMISKAGDHLEPELLQKTPLRKTVQWFVSKYEEDDRLKQKGVFPDKTNAKSEKYDSKGSEEYYGAIDDESMVEPASKEQMEHPVTDKMTRDTSMGVEYAPAPELILCGDMDLSDKAVYHLDHESLQRAPSRITVELLTRNEGDHRLKQKGVFPDKTNAKSEKYDSKGSEEYYGAIDAESRVEQASKEQMEHPVTDKMTRDTSMGVEYAPAPELILRDDQGHEETESGNIRQQDIPKGSPSNYLDGDVTIPRRHYNTDPNLQKDLLTESSACMECVKAIPVCSKEHIKPGDHITFHGRIYDHHAIVVSVSDVSKDQSDSEVFIEIVHATNSPARETLASLHPFGSKARLRRVKKIINFKKRKVMVFKYSSDVQTYPSAEIAKRAIDAAHGDEVSRKDRFIYDLLRNNCEHFATWCVTGRKLSLQERKFTMVFSMFLKSGFHDIRNEFARNEKEYESGMLCKNCYSRNKTLLDVPKKNVMDANDITSGDIIIYSYYFLLHCAVVLGVLKIRKNYVKCQIAHYASCFPWAHRKIVQEDLIIPLDGSVMVTVYPNNFNVFPPEEVVDRARSRIGEQMFAFFTNDSSTFSRWCKLKLMKSTS